jgi:hypothetical protein
MPKPIFIVKVPTNDPSLNVEAVQRINNNLVEMMSDYHVLFIGDNRKRGGVKFECFNTSDLRTVDFDYLKWYVKDNLLTQK